MLRHSARKWPQKSPLLRAAGEENLGEKTRRKTDSARLWAVDLSARRGVGGVGGCTYPPTPDGDERCEVGGVPRDEGGGVSK